MRIRFSHGFAIYFCLVAAIISPASIRAQDKEIDRLGRDLAESCSKQVPRDKILAVADLQDTNGGKSEQGHYFSLLLTFAISFREKGASLVADHNGFDSALQKAGISPWSFTATPSVAVIAGKINANVVVIGDFQQQQDGYLLHLSGTRVSDGAVVCSASVKFRRNEFLDSLSNPFPPPNGDVPIRVRPADPEQHLTPPQCQHCQIPTYSSAARAEKIQGTVAFEAMISKEGKMVALRPIKVLGLGLNEAAYDLIANKWKFKPATTKEGIPITVIVPIEVTFRLY